PLGIDHSMRLRRSSLPISATSRRDRSGSGVAAASRSPRITRPPADVSRTVRNRWPPRWWRLFPRPPRAFLPEPAFLPALPGLAPERAPPGLGPDLAAGRPRPWRGTWPPDEVAPAAPSVDRTVRT